jgi:hypothetical protein
MLFDAAVESIDSPPFLVPSTLILVPARYLSRGYHLDSTSRTFFASVCHAHGDVRC